ncbi:MAG: hypothetical protein OEM63_10180, partial [Gammaproteobacteria bacterium]|nr:hypothetical protein [Gammaproteobacteria bacterium]
MSCLTLLVFNLASTIGAAQDFSNLEDTRHDLAIYTQPVSGDETSDVRCVACHPPLSQTLAPGLWNKSGTHYLLDYPYDRPSEETPAGKPDGSSLVCLGCHDGTIAFGDNLGRAQSARDVSGVARSVLSDGHPVSLIYDSSIANGDNKLASPESLSHPVKLDDRGKIQCTSCHDPHDDSYGKFLVMEDGKKSLCVSCHKNSNWDMSTHNSSSAAWNYRVPDPWPHTDSRGTVAEHGCANCHTPHSAGDGRYLLNFASEEDNCLSCHNGNVAIDIRTEFTKVSHHPVEQRTGAHRADEAIAIPESDRHVECIDCHEPHSVGIAKNNDDFSYSRNVPGIDVNGSEKTEAVAEFELCFRCHGDGPASRAMPTPRVHDQTNVRLQFDNGNPSFHPVVGPGNNTNVSSLIAPYAENSTIGCSDCHSSDADSRLGGQGPDGPHGSIYASLLIRNYQTQDRTPESPSAYALCYSCHD